MRIFLIRHGESEGNVEKTINDDPRRIVKLTQRGREQARAAAEHLREVPFTHAYVSEFTRAQQTIGIVLRHHGCLLRTDARLNERRTGMDGLDAKAFNELVRPDPLYARPEQGESFVQLMERLRDFLDDVAASYPRGVVLAASHEHPILAAYALTVDDPEQVVCHSRLDNCEWVELDWPPGCAE